MEIKLSPDVCAVRTMIGERQPRKLPEHGVEHSAALGCVRETWREAREEPTSLRR